MSVFGKQEFLKKLNEEISKIKGASVQGLAVAASLIKNASQEKTPVDTGNLRASHYVVTYNFKTDETTKEKYKDYNISSKTNARILEIHKNASQYKVEIGCTAKYAIEVHEELEWKHKTGQAKFLESAVNQYKSNIIEIIHKYVKKVPEIKN